MNAIVRQALFQPPDPARAIIRSKNSPAFLFGDPNPLLYPSAGLAPRYLESTGITPASASAETIGLALDESEGAALGAELVPADYTTAWSDVGNIDVQPTQIVAASSNGDMITWATAAEENSFYEVSLTISGFSGAGQLQLRFGSTGSGDANISADGDYTYRIRADGTSFSFRAGGGVASSWTITNVSVRKIAGFHAYQSTPADEPSLILADGIWRYRGDGVSDHFLTTLNPATSMTYIVACVFDVENDAPIGALGSGSAGFSFITQNGAALGGGVGTDAQNTITGGSSITGIPGVAALSYNGSLVRLFWKPFDGPIQKLYEEAQNGSSTTSVPIAVGGRNQAGTVGRWLDGDIFRALAQQSAYTDAEVAAIASQWSRELGWTP